MTFKVILKMKKKKKLKLVYFCNANAPSTVHLQQRKRNGIIMLLSTLLRMDQPFTHSLLLLSQAQFMLWIDLNNIVIDIHRCL